MAAADQDLLDKATRTQAVRIEVPDPEHRLHPGVFVDVVLFAGDAEPVLAVPETAVLRGPDGDWQVFVAEADDRCWTKSSKRRSATGCWYCLG